MLSSAWWSSSLVDCCCSHRVMQSWLVRRARRRDLVATWSQQHPPSSIPATSRIYRHVPTQIFNALHTVIVVALNVLENKGTRPRKLRSGAQLPDKPTESCHGLAGSAGCRNVATHHQHHCHHQPHDMPYRLLFKGDYTGRHIMFSRPKDIRDWRFHLAGRAHSQKPCHYARLQCGRPPSHR